MRGWTPRRLRDRRPRLEFEQSDMVRRHSNWEPIALARFVPAKESTMTSAPRLRPRVEQEGKRRILTFGGGPIRGIENRLERELEGLTEQLEGCHLMLDFRNVESIGSEELGTIVTLHKRLNRDGGRLTLFNLSRRVLEVFAVTRIDTLVRVCREVDEDGLPFESLGASSPE